VTAPQFLNGVRAALYLRVSTARQAEHDISIPDQKRQGEAYCEQRGYQLVETYMEPGATATNDKRPEFQRMIEAGTSKPAPSILSWCIASRASSAITSRWSFTSGSWRRTASSWCPSRTRCYWWHNTDRSAVLLLGGEGEDTHKLAA